MKPRKFLSLALALVMVLALMPTIAMAGGFGGIVTNAKDAQGEGWSWDHKTLTLTLNGYDGDGFEAYLAEDYKGSLMTAGICDLTIELAAGSNNYIRGQISAANLIVRGSGSLTIEYNNDFPIRCASFKMESGTVKLKSGGRISGSMNMYDENGVLEEIPIYTFDSIYAEKTEILGGTLVAPGLDMDEVSLANAHLIITEGERLTTDKLTIRNSMITWMEQEKAQDNFMIYCGETIIDGLRIFCEGGSVIARVDGDVKPKLANAKADWDSTQHFIFLRPEGAPTAYPSTQTVDVDGKAVEFQCYALKDAAGNDTNYIKLRDLADILSGSAAQFEVGWNDAVTITTGQAYTKNGSEQNTPFSGQREYKEADADTLVNGEAKPLAAFILTDDAGGGYTYYKLRDLGAALGFKVDWSAEKGIFIETK